MRYLLLLALAVPLLAQNPETAVYPGAIATDNDLYCWKNSATTQLNGAINNSTLTVVVDDGSKLCAPGVVTIDAERMKVCSISTNTLTICSGGRGFNSSSAASHSDNAAVSQFVPAKWFNQLAKEIIAIQTLLGVNGANFIEPGDINSLSEINAIVGVTLVDTLSTQTLFSKTFFAPKIATSLIGLFSTVIPSPAASQVIIAVDGLDTSDCSLGGGSEFVLCFYDGSDWIPLGGGGGGSGDVEAASTFGTDNVIIRSDGTGKGVQSTGCTVDDSNNLSCPGTISTGSASNTIATVEGSTADANEATLVTVDPTGDRTHTFPDATGTVTHLETAQTFATGTKTVTARFDFGGGTLEVPNSGTLPGTCTVGEVYMDTDATSGQRIYACESSNTWVLQGGGGSGGDLTVIASSVTANTNGAGGTVTHADVTVPADTFAAGDTVRVTSVWTKTGTTDTWNPWVAFGASGESGTGNAVTGNSAVVAGTLSVRQVGEFQVLTTTSQDGFAQIWKSSTVTVQPDISQAEDVTAETHFYFRNTCTSASDDCTLVSYLIERIR